MKRVLLSLLCVTNFSAAIAQNPHTTEGHYEPSIYIISERHTEHRNTLHATIIDDYIETSRSGFQQSHNPQFILATPDNRFSLALGGMVNLRTSYDFNNAVNNIDFVTADIAVPGSYANRQRVMMDASTSRLFLKAIINTPCIGRIVIYSDMDFRGGEQFSYIPRLRSAYIQLCGLTLGRDVTTFCDLNAAPTTIDFEGPNAYNFRFTEMIRYEHSFLRNHLTLGIAAEVPSVNATYGDYFSPIMQRVPDGIAYVQYAWGENRASHLRVSGVIRDMYLHNNTTDDNTTQLGWGVQLSGHIRITRWVDLYMNGVYGKGITPYIQDLTGLPYDCAYNPQEPTRMQTMPMWGWQAAAQVNILPKVMWVAAGYSMVGLEKHNGFLSDNEYRQGDYLFVNAFWNVTRNFTVAAEYLHGSRENMDTQKQSANRVSIMAQYKF